MTHSSLSKSIAISVSGLALAVAIASCGGSSESSTAKQVVGVTSTSLVSAGASTTTAGSKVLTTTSSGSARCQGNGFTVLCASVDIAGSRSLKGSTKVTTVAQSCAAFASNVTPRQAGTLTLPSLYEDVNGVPFSFGVFVESYTGPGRYGLEKLGGPGSDFLLIVGDETYTEAAASTGSLTIEANGAGEFTFTNFASQSSGNTVNGSATWTCSDT